jgi:hypothetical protein
MSFLESKNYFALFRGSTCLHESLPDHNMAKLCRTTESQLLLSLFTEDFIIIITSCKKLKTTDLAIVG